MSPCFPLAVWCCFRHDLSIGRSFDSSVWTALFKMLFPNGLEKDCHFLECPCSTSSLLLFLLKEAPWAQKVVYTGLVERGPARFSALERLVNDHFRKATTKESEPLGNVELEELNERAQIGQKEFLEKERPFKPRAKPTWSMGMIMDPQSPYPEHASLRKAMHRGNAKQEVDSHLPPALHWLMQSVEFNVLQIPSLLNSGFGLVATLDHYLGGCEMMKIMKKGAAQIIPN